MTKLGADEGVMFAKHFAAFLGFSLLGWFVSWWNLSLVGVVFICAIYSWKVTFEKMQKLQKEQTTHFFKNEKQAIQEIFEDIPRWVFFPDIERVEWINKIAAQLWPDVTSYVRDFLLNNMEEKIQKSLPKKINSFEFKKIDLGDKPPRITGVKVYGDHVSDDEIIIDIDVFYAGDAAVRIKIAGLEAGVKDIQLKGTLRVVLKPILRYPPFVGGVQLYFLTNPMLEFGLTDAARVLEIPGLHALLRTTLLTLIANYLILPNKLSFALSSSVSTAQLLFTEPKGVLKVELLEAKNLVGHDLTSKSDPYVIMTVGAEQYTSEVIENCHNPVWNEVHFFTVLELDGADLYMQLYDKDSASNDDVIGRMTVSLRSIAKEGRVEGWRDFANDEGSLHFICTWYDLKAEVPETSLGSDSDDYQPTAVLSVFVDSAKCLEVFDDAEPSTLVTLTIGPEEKCTSSMLSTQNPVYNDNFHFLLNDFTLLETLTMKVCDIDSDDVYGTVSKPLRSITSAPGMVVHRPHVLAGAAGNSELMVRASVKYLVATTASENEPAAESDAVDSTGSEDAAEEVNVTMDESSGMEPEVVDVDSNLRKRRTDGDGDSVEPPGGPKVRSSSYEEATRKVTTAGDIELTLVYNKPENKLTVTVLRCRELLTNAGLSEDEAPNAYVKLCLMPDKSHKCKTNTYKDSFYPVYNETFQFTVSASDMLSLSLAITVKHYESIFKKSEIGKASIPLSSINTDKSLTRWFPLQQIADDDK